MDCLLIGVAALEFVEKRFHYVEDQFVNQLLAHPHLPSSHQQFLSSNNHCINNIHQLYTAKQLQPANGTSFQTNFCKKKQIWWRPDIIANNFIRELRNFRSPSTHNKFYLFRYQPCENSWFRNSTRKSTNYIGFVINKLLYNEIL